MVGDIGRFEPSSTHEILFIFLYSFKLVDSRFCGGNPHPPVTAR